MQSPVLPTLADMTHRTVAPQQLASLISRVYRDELDDCVNESAGILHGIIVGHGGEVAGPCMVIYHGPVEGAQVGPIEVCLPYTGELTFDEEKGEEKPPELKLYTAPQRTEAFMRLAPQQLTADAINHISRLTLAYARDNGTPAAFPRQFYYPAAQPDGTVAEISWPFAWMNQIKPHD